MNRLVGKVLFVSLVLAFALSACAPASASMLGVGLPLEYTGYLSSGMLDADLPGEPVYLESQVVPECDTGVFYVPGKMLQRRNGCDSWSTNQVERPFTADGKVYLPELDITDAQMGSDKTWFYWKVNLYPFANGKPQPTHILVELDVDNDGRGDTALELDPGALKTDGWQSTGLRILEDRNHDNGGLKPVLADPTTANGDGYETVATSGSLWARPLQSGFGYELALKADYFTKEKLTLGWWVWTVGASLELKEFDLVDRYGPTELYGLDNTCMMMYGEKTTKQFTNQCYKAGETNIKKKEGSGSSGGCVQGPKPSTDSCWLWYNCAWVCFN